MLVWLLTLALPLQGLAASLRLGCHAATVPTMPATADAAPCHQAVHASRTVAGADAAAAVTGDFEPTHPGSAGHAGCIGCAACHGAAALPSPVTLAGEQMPSIAPATRTPTAALPYITDGPERPPRSLPT